MSAARRRAKAAQRRNTAIARFPSTCPNCGQSGQHFAVPALGDPGFYMCASLTQTGQSDR